MTIHKLFISTCHGTIFANSAFVLCRKKRLKNCCPVSLYICQVTKIDEFRISFVRIVMNVSKVTSFKDYLCHCLSLCLCHCLFGQISSPHHYGQISKRSQVSKMALLMCSLNAVGQKIISKGSIVTDIRNYNKSLQHVVCLS